MTRHKHYDIIVAWAEGAEVQSKDDDRWMDTLFPTWHPNNEYRIKPKTVQREGWVNIASYGTATRYPQRIVYESREQAEKDKGDDTVGTAKIEWSEEE